MVVFFSFFHFPLPTGPPSSFLFSLFYHQLPRPYVATSINFGPFFLCSSVPPPLFFLS